MGTVSSLYFHSAARRGCKYLPLYGPLCYLLVYLGRELTGLWGYDNRPSLTYFPDSTYFGVFFIVLQRIHSIFPPLSFSFCHPNLLFLRGPPKWVRQAVLFSASRGDFSCPLSSLLVCQGLNFVGYASLGHFSVEEGITSIRFPLPSSPFINSPFHCGARWTLAINREFPCFLIPS